jgi:hypothetical protein
MERVSKTLCGLRIYDKSLRDSGRSASREFYTG